MHSSLEASTLTAVSQTSKTEACVLSKVRIEWISISTSKSPYITATRCSPDIKLPSCAGGIFFSKSGLRRRNHYAARATLAVGLLLCIRQMMIVFFFNSLHMCPLSPGSSAAPITPANHYVLHLKTRAVLRSWPVRLSPILLPRPFGAKAHASSANPKPSRSPTGSRVTSWQKSSRTC